MKRYQAYIIAILPVFYTLHFCFTANIKAQIKKIKAGEYKSTKRLQSLHFRENTHSAV